MGLFKRINIRSILDFVLLGTMLFIFTYTCVKLIWGHYISGSPIWNLQDLASINQAIWNTAQGNILHASILYDGNRDHFELILFFYALIYRFGGDFIHLLIVHILFIGLGAVPIYLLGKFRKLSLIDIILLCSLYFLFPIIHNMLNMEYIRPDILFFPAFATMIYAVVSSKRRLLLFSVFLSLLCKESAAFSIFGLGLYLLFVEKERKYSIVFLIVGIFWLPFVHFLYLPLVNDQSTFHTTHISLPYMGKFVKEIKIFLAIFFSTFLLLLLKRWIVIISIPHSIALLFYRVIYRYFIPSISIIFFIFLDYLVVLKTCWIRRSIMIILAGTFIALNIRQGNWIFPEPSPVILKAEPLIKMIPDKASLCTDKLLLLRLSKRSEIYQFNRRHYFSENGRDYIDADYFLIRREVKDYSKNVHRRFRNRSRALEELDRLNLQIVAASKPWILYKKM